MSSSKKKHPKTGQSKRVKSATLLKKSQSHDDHELLGIYSDVVGKGDDDNGNKGGSDSSRRSQKDLLKPMLDSSGNYNDTK